MEGRAAAAVAGVAAAAGGPVAPRRRRGPVGWAALPGTALRRPAARRGWLLTVRLAAGMGNHWGARLRAGPVPVRSFLRREARAAAGRRTGRRCREAAAGSGAESLR
jgi:hypothetical protein